MPFVTNRKMTPCQVVSISYKLVERNEHFIASNHPIKNQLIKTMGKNLYERKRFVEKVYEDVRDVIPYTWEGIKGYNPETDAFYKIFY